MDPCDIRAEGKPRCSEQRGCTGPIVGHRSRFPIHSRMREWPESAHLVRCGEFRRSSPFWTQRSPQSTAADRKGSVVQTTQPGANRAHHVSGTGSSNPFPSSREFCEPSVPARCKTARLPSVFRRPTGCPHRVRQPTIARKARSGVSPIIGQQRLCFMGMSQTQLMRR